MEYLCGPTEWASSMNGMKINIALELKTAWCLSSAGAGELVGDFFYFCAVLLATHWLCAMRLICRSGLRTQEFCLFLRLTNGCIDSMSCSVSRPTLPCRLAFCGKLCARRCSLVLTLSCGKFTGKKQPRL